MTGLLWEPNTMMHEKCLATHGSLVDIQQMLAVQLATQMQVPKNGNCHPS